jgi:hypothetical protein
MFTSILKTVLLTITVAATAFGLVASAGVADAQTTGGAQTTPIKYGDVVRGALSNKNYQITYTFKGKKDDTVVISYISDYGADKSLFGRVLSVTQGKTVLIDPTNSIGRAFLTLPSDGDYTVIAGRTDGKKGTEEGAFILRLINVQPLEDGTAVTQKISHADVTANTSIDDYYLLQPNGAFTVKYELTDGEERPSIDIDKVYDDGGLSTVASMSGSILDNGVLGITPDKGSTYLVHINDFYTKNSLSYSLTFNNAK